MHKPFKGFMAYEWQIGNVVFQFCHNDNWNWRENATFWRFNIFTTDPIFRKISKKINAGWKEDNYS